MAFARTASVIFAGGVVTATLSMGTAWAGGPGGVVDDSADDIYQALSSGYVGDSLVGFAATGDTEEEAEQAAIAACTQAGGTDCTADVSTNDAVCLVTVGDDDTGVVSGGAGVTVEAAREDAFVHARDFDTPLDANARTLASACP